MLRHVAGFELRYQLTAPAFWVTSIIFFLLTYALVSSDNLQLGWGGQVFRNSPYTIALDCMIMALWAVFILTTFVANVVVRDEETRFGPIIYSTRLSKFDYLFGRFLGAFGPFCFSPGLARFSFCVGGFWALSGPDPWYSWAGRAVPRNLRRCLGETR